MSIAYSHAGYDLDTAVAVAPTLAASAPHDSRSDRYGFVPTLPILQGLYREGFKIHSIYTANVRDGSKVGFEKHMLRLRHASAKQQTERKVGDIHNEIVVVNSHDGSTCYQIFGGIFRLVCLNGMTVPDSGSAQIPNVKIKHTGDIIRDVIEGSYEVFQSFDRLTEARERFQSIKLLKDEQEALATAVLPLRFDVEQPKDAPITAQQLLRARRYDDVGNDLWSTFNVIQENVIKGGVQGRTGNGRRMTTRNIKGIDQDLRVNKGLWLLTEHMANLKEGKPTAIAA